MTGLFFDDGKAQGAMRTIGEVSAALDIKPHILRYWEQHFPMLQPVKRSGGRRLYRREDIELVGRIDQLINKQGYTLKGARQLIEAGTADEAQVKDPARAAEVSPRLRESLLNVRNRLAAALQI